MGKIITGTILLIISILNVIGFIYLSITNPDKLSNHAEYFGKKITFAIGIGALGLWLILSSRKNKNEALPKKD